MRLALYKGLRKGTRIYDKLICLWTLSKYSHCELILTNGSMFSSSPRDGGCRYKTFEYDSDKWDVYYINSTETTEYYVKKFCDDQIGKKYDWVGIFLGLFLPFKQQDPNKWFCSEILGRIFGVDKPQKYTPSKIYKYMKKRNFIFINEKPI